MSEKIDIVVSSDASLPSSSSQDDWLNLMMAGKREEIGNKLPNRPLIPRVPSTFRKIEQNRKCYDPSVVSIGPYHHGKDEFKEMQDRKFTLARQFIQDSGKAPEEMYRKVKELASSAKKCYTEDSTKDFDDEKFSQMLFLDGCFILHFLFCLYEKPQNLKMSSHDAALVTKDLFLLENQLPFNVLKTLMSSRFGSEGQGKGMKYFKVFFKRIRAVPPHPTKSFREKVTKSFRQKACWSTLEHEATDQAAHLLALFHVQFVGRKDEIKPDCSQTSPYEDDSKASWYPYYPAMELRKVGIHFRPSKTSLFTDVHFRSTILAARLRIPPLRIDDSTKSLLLNLVAYEACLETSNDWITSYVCFMDSLIDHPEDVKQLRSHGILLTSLGSDQQVADLFNEMANNLVPNPYAFMEVKRAIESHYKISFKRWVAEWMSTYFRSPWSFITLVAAIFTIVLTAIQSYFAMFPLNNNSDSCK